MSKDDYNVYQGQDGKWRGERVEVKKQAFTLLP